VSGVPRGTPQPGGGINWSEWNGTLAGYWHMIEERDKRMAEETKAGAAKPTAAEKERGPTRKVKHPEAVAIDRVSEIMEELPEPSRHRVLRWALDVYWPETIVNAETAPVREEPS
jgi:hypothetical protein